MSERIKAWLSRDLTRDEFLRWMFLQGVFGVLIMGSTAILLGVSISVLELGVAAFVLVWLWRIFTGFRGLEREA